MKYTIKNCPNCMTALYADGTVQEYQCGLTDRDCLCVWVTEKHCLLKQIVEKCKEKIIFCKSCSKNADINIDCVECDERGEAHFAQCILNNFLEIEEVNE